MAIDIDTQLQEYLRVGFYLFPCHSIMVDQFGVIGCTCGKPDCTNQGKHPRTRTGVKEATNNPEMIGRYRSAFGDDNINWGLAQGKLANTFVVDVDPKDGGDETWADFIAGQTFPETLTATTGSGGKHLFFAYPGRHIGNRVGWRQGVDIRSDNGYVIAAPARHISGGEYSWDNWGHAITAAPEFLIDAILGVGGGGLGAKPLPSNNDLISGAPEGERDVLIFRAACRWRRQFGDDPDARAMVTSMVITMANKSVPPFPEDEAMKKVEQAYAQDHTDDDLIVPFSGVPAGRPSSAGGDDDPIFGTTEMGNRDRFVRAYGDRYRYVLGMGWYKWGDLGWVADKEDIEVLKSAAEVPNLVRDEVVRLEMNGVNARLVQRYRNWAQQSETQAKTAATAGLAKIPLSRNAEDFDSVPHELACRNGMVDLRDGSLRPFKTDDLITKNTRVLYDPDFTLPQWEYFLESATNGDESLKEYLQVAAGYTLTGSTDQECFFVISGPPRSGKTTYLDGLIAALGSYTENVDATVFTRRAGRDVDRSDMVKFYGPRLITTSELPEGSRFDDAFLKRITGGDMMNARMLYRESFSFRPKFKLWMATNHDPVTQDSAMFARIRRVRFPTTVAPDKLDPRLKEIIKDPQIGGKAVLAWAIKGAQLYYQLGKVPTPGVVTAANADYQDDQNLFRQFLNETFELDPNASITVTTAFGHWDSWCRANGVREIGDRIRFTKRIEEHTKLMVTRGTYRTIMGVTAKAGAALLPWNG